MGDALGPVPATLAGPDGRLLTGLWAGHVVDDPVATVRQRGGRVRRWSYAAAGDHDVQVGAAVVDVGIGATAFVWCCADGRVSTWERTVIGGRGVTVPDRPSAGGAAAFADATVAIDARGGLRFDVPVGPDRLRAHITAVPTLPAVCATATPRGGWNVTQKAAGHRAHGHVSLGPRSWALDGGGWSDWTAGRQDRNTDWRWAAGAGEVDGRPVGFNLSTGMNGAGAGENVVWWDGQPYALDLQDLAPVSDPAADWVLAGPGWELRFEAAAVRAADENLLLLRSQYVQPIGRFHGTLPGPEGDAVPVDLVGVTEDHHARW